MGQKHSRQKLKTRPNIWKLVTFIHSDVLLTRTKAVAEVEILSMNEASRAANASADAIPALVALVRAGNAP